LLQFTVQIEQEFRYKKRKSFTIAQWYPRMCVYDDVRGWNTNPYLGAENFYLEYGDFDIYRNFTSKSL
jgi:hypothetical protein